jgi:hypothetical protein
MNLSVSVCVTFCFKIIFSHRGVWVGRQIEEYILKMNLVTHSDINFQQIRLYYVFFKHVKSFFFFFFFFLLFLLILLKKHMLLLC